MSKADLANERVQRSTGPDDALAYLATLSVAVVRAVADRNYVDPDGGRLTVARRIVADRWPTD